jgi:hypothetical protein
MKNAIKAEIKRLSGRAFYKLEKQNEVELKYQNRFKKRTGITAGTSSPRLTPAKHIHFDPRYCARNANFLAKTIWFKVLQNQYNQFLLLITSSLSQMEQNAVLWHFQFQMPHWQMSF